MLEFLAGAHQAGLDGFFGRLELFCDLPHGAMVVIFRFQQRPFLGQQAIHVSLQEELQIRARAVIVGRRAFDGGVLREAVQKREVAAALAVLVGARAAGEHREPAPKGGFIGEDADVPDHPPERFLQRFPRGVFVAGGDDQQITGQSIEVGIVENAVGRFVAGDQLPGQCRHVERVPRIPVGRGGVIRWRRWIDRQTAGGVAHGLPGVTAWLFPVPAWPWASACLTHGARHR